MTTVSHEEGNEDFAHRELHFELLGRRAVRFSLTTAGLFVMILALVGPIGSYESLTLLQRFVYCGVSCAFCWPVCYSINVVTCYFVRDRRQGERALAATLAQLVAAVPCTAVTASYQTLFHADYRVYDGIITLYVLVASLAVSCCLLFHYIFSQRSKQSASLSLTGRAAADGNAAAKDVATPVGGASVDAADPVAAMEVESGAGPDGRDGPGDGVPRGRHPAESTGEHTTPTPTDGAAPGQGRFLDRLPPELGRDLTYLRSRDHYVEVHTVGGTGRVLLRFADAVAELGDLGIQVHRSYWVARGHVRELVTRGNRMAVRVADDQEVPVSRTYVPALRAAMSDKGPATSAAS